MGSSTRGPGPLTRQCAAPPPPPRPGGGLCGEGPCPARALPPPSVVGLQRRDRRVPWVGFPQRVLRPAPRAACAAGPRKRVRPDPPHGVGCPARGRGPGSWRGERAVPHEADECVRTESGGRRPSSARRCRCCGPQPGAAVGGDREGACSRARLCLVRSVGIAPGAGQWTSLLGPRSVSHGDFGGARLDSDCVPVCLGGSACVAWGAVAVSAGVESERPARAWPGASWSRGARGARRGQRGPPGGGPCAPGAFRGRSHTCDVSAQ